MKLTPAEIETIEIDLLIEAIRLRYGYDFRHYAKASLRRRLLHRLALNGDKQLSELIPKVLHDEPFIEVLLQDLSITVTEMFRDPFVFSALREKVLPLLQTYSSLKIWHAGCATGEEVYSLAILLHEAGLLARCKIYATDFNNKSLQLAQRGLLTLTELKQCEINYQESGGSEPFSNYYRTKYESAKLHSFLSDKVTFANHNLVTDGVFGQMHLILCRNVLIYFNNKLQDRVLTIFRDSLVHRGVLCIGDKESLEFSSVKSSFVPLDKQAKIYRFNTATLELKRRKNAELASAVSDEGR